MIVTNYKKANSLKQLVYISHNFVDQYIHFNYWAITRNMSFLKWSFIITNFLCEVWSWNSWALLRSHKIASTFQASRRNLSAILPLNLCKCKIIIRVTILLPLSSIMWHNHGNEYPVIFTVLAYTQEEERNLKGRNSRVRMYFGKHLECCLLNSL